MKTTNSLVCKLALLVFVFSSCAKDKSSTDPSTSAIVGQGTWKVTLYNNSSNEETQNFAGYNFTFNTNGTITAVKNTSTVNGTWNTGVDDSQNKLILDFGTAVQFSELNEDWVILEKTASKIRLEHVSGGNGGTDLLTFEKK